MYALTKEEGGRHTPFTSKYMPQFFFRTADVNGEWVPVLPPGGDMDMTLWMWKRETVACEQMMYSLPNACYPRP